MDATAADRGAFAEAVVFLSDFDDLPDPRQRGMVVYPLDEGRWRAMPASPARRTTAGVDGGRKGSPRPATRGSAAG